jgi:hypothetical protein
VGEDAGAVADPRDATSHGPAWLPQLEAEAWELAFERTPPASLVCVREGESMARWVLARLEPLHNDPAETQQEALPELATMAADERAALSARFHPTDDLSFRQWCARLRLDVAPRGGPARRGGAAEQPRDGVANGGWATGASAGDEGV